MKINKLPKASQTCLHKIGPFIPGAFQRFYTWERENVPNSKAASTGQNLNWPESQLARTSKGQNANWPERQLARTPTGQNVNWPERQLARTSTGQNDNWPERQLVRTSTVQGSWSIAQPVSSEMANSVTQKYSCASTRYAHICLLTELARSFTLNVSWSEVRCAYIQRPSVPLKLADSFPMSVNWAINNIHHRTTKDQEMYVCNQRKKILDCLSGRA